MPPRSPHIILCWKCRIFKGIGAALGATWPLTQCGMAISGSAIVCWWHTPFPGWYTIPARSQSPMILGGLQVASYQRSDKNHDIRCGMVLTHIHKKYKKGWVNNRLHKNLSLYPCTARAKRFRYSTSTCKESILQHCLGSQYSSREEWWMASTPQIQRVERRGDEWMWLYFQVLNPI